jgi:hypothetical protein
MMIWDTIEILRILFMIRVLFFVAILFRNLD